MKEQPYRGRSFQLATDSPLCLLPSVPLISSFLSSSLSCNWVSIDCVVITGWNVSPPHKQTITEGKRDIGHQGRPAEPGISSAYIMSDMLTCWPCIWLDRGAGETGPGSAAATGESAPAPYLERGWTDSSCLKLLWRSGDLSKREGGFAISPLQGKWRQQNQWRD